MPAVRVVDEHLNSPVVVYESSGGVFKNERILSAGSGIILEKNQGVEIGVDLDFLVRRIGENFAQEIVFNETPIGALGDNNQFFSLRSDPTKTDNVQVWKNGQLLTQTEDYTVEGRLIQLVIPPGTEDVILASYSRRILLKRYSIGERITIDLVTCSGELSKMPSSPDDLMFFYNGQLLSRGSMEGDRDYTVVDNKIKFNGSVDTRDVFQATYAYL